MYLKRYKIWIKNLKNYIVIWGGFKHLEPYYGDVILKILLNARISPIIEITYVLLLIFLTVYVKIVMTGGQPAGVKSISTWQASQRLNAGDLKKKFFWNISILNSSFKNINLLIHNYNTKLFIRGFTSDKRLAPSYISGFSDGESSFHISVLRNEKYKILYSILPVFTIQLHIKDINLTILPHFNKYPLLTQKSADYLLFKEVVNLMNKGEHLTEEG